MNYSKRIKEYRKNNGLTQKEFSENIGVKVNTVSRWENNKFSPNAKTLKKLSFLFDVDDNPPKDLIKSPINYTGNKYRILEQILPFMPEKVDVFVDMFCGGATVGSNVNANKVYFIDNNERVISLLRFLANLNFGSFVKKLEDKIDYYGLSYSNLNGYSHYFNLAKPININDGLKLYNKEGFYKLRNDYNQLPNKDSDEANVLLYLLLVYGFNNDLRFNSKGHYNLPCGKTDLNKNNLNKVYNFNLRAQERKFIFLCGDFRDPKIQEICMNADYVYFDPPYLLTDAVYNEASKWNEATEQKLIDFLIKLQDKVPFSLSNVLTKNEGADVNAPLYNFIDDNKNIKMIDIDYHYRSSSYNKKNRDANEREILVVSGGKYENKNK